MKNTILISPIVTEKATANAQKNVYGFLVAKNATKSSVKHAVTSYYNVEVDKIRIVVRKGKVQRVGRRMTPKRLPDKKIAFVHVTKGSISLFPKA